MQTAPSQLDWKLDVTSLQLSTNSLGRLCAGDGMGRHVEGVIPIRLFPLSDPEHWIALVDENQRELCVIPDLATLAEPAALCLKEELARREFVPIVQRITWVSGNSEPCEWKVITDRGPVEFILQSDDDIRRLGKKCVLVVDAHGIRYLIPDDRQLDAYSRRIIDWYV